ncbi:hypothetical protein A3Q56_02702 [Intoshia linei]|uniref:Uncharacterized protein n=1 Tax=Intoshia linei TaxID=1819745 RepID=A0A177B633_9BILA|nr:hypothetical protein A3Q56_02702 [Intoshia linei]
MKICGFVSCVKKCAKKPGTGYSNLETHLSVSHPNNKKLALEMNSESILKYVELKMSNDKK